MTDKDLKNPLVFSEGYSDKAVIIVHGFTGDCKDTEMIFKHFKKEGYTVARPILPGHTGDVDEFLKYTPTDWLDELKKWVSFLTKKVEKVYIVTVSFGGNLALSVCADDSLSKKVKKLILLEPPLVFNLKIRLMMSLVQPVFNFLGIKKLKKNKIFYRSGYERSDDESLDFLPIKSVGEVRDFIKDKTLKILSLVKTPCLIIQSKNSDLLDSAQNVKFICSNLGSSYKEVYYVDVDNHDLNLLDETGKMLMLKKMFDFIES